MQLRFTIFVVTSGHIPQMVTNLYYLKLVIDANALPLLDNISIEAEGYGATVDYFYIIGLNTFKK